MAKVEILVSVTDELDIISGHKRKKEGDIIAVRPHPWNWGRKEIANGLVVIIESDEPFDALAERLEGPGDNGERNKCSIPLDNLKEKIAPNLDLSKVRNRNYIYQPFKAKSQLLEKLDIPDELADCGLQPEIEGTCGKEPNIIFHKKSAKFVKPIDAPKKGVA